MVGARGGVRSQRLARHLLAARVEARADHREQRAAQRQRVGLRDAHRGFGGLQIGIVVDAVLDQPVELARTEHFPPLRRNLCAALERRSRAVAAVGQIAFDRRRRRRHEVRADGTAREHADDRRQQREPCAPGSGRHTSDQPHCGLTSREDAFMRGRSPRDENLSSCFVIRNRIVKFRTTRSPSNPRAISLERG